MQNNLESPRPTIFSANVLCIVACVGLWIGSIVATIIAPQPGVAQDFAIDACFYMPFTVLPVVLCMLKKRGMSDAIRLNPMPVLPMLSVAFIAIACVLVASCLNTLWAIPLKAIGLSEPSGGVEIANRRELMFGIINSAAVPAVCEELLFRGYIHSAWESRGTVFAGCITTAMFALLHGNLFGLPAYLLAGAVSTFIVVSLDSLYAGMTFHTVYNATILVLMYMTRGAEEAAAEAVDYLTLSFDILVMAGFMGVSMFAMNARRRMIGIEIVPRVREKLRLREKVTLVVLSVLLIGSVVLVAALGG